MHFPACHPFQRITAVTIHYRCCCLFTAVTTYLPSLLTVSTSAASAASASIAATIHRCLSPPLVLHHQKRN
jgi:hypothetical protein